MAARWCLSAASTLLLAVAAALPAAPEPVRIGTQKQLFVDDYIIDSMHNVQQHVNPIRKIGKPIVSPDEPWEGTCLVLWGVCRDPSDGRFRMWYSGYAIPESGKGPGWHPCYAESKDGIHWTKPRLGVVEFEGSKDNNLVEYQGLVVPDPRPEEGARRYKMLCAGWGGYGYCYSADGIHWTAYEGNPVVDMTGDEAPTIFDETKNLFVTYMKTEADLRDGYGVRRLVGRRTSPDMIHWTDSVRVLVPDKWEDERAKVKLATRKGWMQYYGMLGFPYEGMYLGLLWSFFCNPEKVGTTEGVIHTELTCSRDGQTWQHAADREPVIPQGTPGSFDGGLVDTRARPIYVGDEIWIYYIAFESTHGCYWYAEPKTDEPLKRGFISMGKLRRDGWVSIDAIYDKGTLTTKPFIFDGNRLWVNTDASEGSVSVSIIDAERRPIPGFGARESTPLKGGAVRQLVSWGGNADVRELAGRPIRLKFSLENARLYAFWFGDT